MKSMKKKVSVAVTAALLTLPLSSALAMASVPNTSVLVATSTTTTAPATTITELQATEAAEVAVTTYEAGLKSTLEEVSIAEGLKAAAVTAVAAVGDVEDKEAFELRIKNQVEAIATAKTALQEAAAEVAVAAYESGPITTLAEVATAKDLKEVAVKAVAAVGDVDLKTAFDLRVTDRAEAIKTAQAALSAMVVDVDGNEITPATMLSDLINRLQLALAFDPARKCELNERQALRKLAQAHKLMKDGNVEASQISLNEYTDKIAKAQAFLLEIEKTDSETANTLNKALDNLESNNILVLSNLIDKLPPQAAEKLALNVVRSMEKAVAKIQKEEAKVALETTPATTPVTTPVTDNEVLEKQAKIALENFKKSINQKGKIHLEDQDRDQKDNEDKNVAEQEKSELEKNTQHATQTQTPNVTVLPVKTQKAPTVVRPTENARADQNKQDVHENDKRGDNQGHNK